MQYVCCLVVTQLKEGWREPKLSMRRRELGVTSKVFLEHILAKPVFKTPPSSPLCVRTSDASLTSKCRFKDPLWLKKYYKGEQFWKLKISVDENSLNSNSGLGVKSFSVSVGNIVSYT